MSIAHIDIAKNDYIIIFMMTERKKKKLMKDYGFKQILAYVMPEEYEAMRHYCFDMRLKHSQFIRQLITDKLRKEGYLKETKQKT